MTESESYPSLDPDIFEEARRSEFNLAIINQSERFVEAKDMITAYLYENDPATQAAAKKEMEEAMEQGKTIIAESITNLMGRLGATLTVEAVDSSVKPIPSVSTERYNQAVVDKAESEHFLVTAVTGYQAYVEHVIKGLYRGPLSDEEKAWDLTWQKLRDPLREKGGGTLADIAVFFDQLVALRFPNTFDPMDVSRGSEARLNVSTRTFYRVFHKHLGTAIHQRDSWS